MRRCLRSGSKNLKRSPTASRADISLVLFRLRNFKAGPSPVRPSRVRLRMTTRIRGEAFLCVKKTKRYSSAFRSPDDSESVTRLVWTERFAKFGRGKVSAGLGLAGARESRKRRRERTSGRCGRGDCRSGRINRVGEACDGRPSPARPGRRKIERRLRVGFLPAAALEQTSISLYSSAAKGAVRWPSRRARRLQRCSR